MNKKWVYTIIVTVTGACEEVIRNEFRRKGQKKLQERVDVSVPAPVKKEKAVDNENIQLTILNDNSVNLDLFRESPMSENEVNEWKSLISALVGENSKSALTAISFNGLLKCDVPLKDLCRVVNDPGSLRGMVISDGKISKQASFSVAGLGNVAPLLVYQCMAAVTSQYYQQIITERLNSIEKKIDNIISILAADDRAKLKVAYNRFVELSKKNSYDIVDKQIASEFSGYVEIIREKYRELLLGIKHLNVSHKWSDEKEAELKIQALNDSHYFDYLEMAMQAEAITYITSAISMKIAIFLDNTEDAKIYAERMNLDYWNNYEDQFIKMKHDVIEYLKGEADGALIQRETIIAMKEEQLKKFYSVEEAMLKLQKQFECRTIQYLQVQNNGELKKYISLSQS